MKFSLEQIRSVARGCVSVSEENGRFRFFRFPSAQSEAYLSSGKENFYRKTFASAGVRLAFRSNTETLSFTAHTGYGSSRRFGFFDCYENGRMTAHFGADEMQDVDRSFSVTFQPGEKDIELYFPWSVRTDLSDVTVDDGAKILPINRKHTMISFGDSITQGYDVRFPSLSYAAQLARELDANSVNKGIGGDIFFPKLLKEADPITPDYVTVAYGSNDWSRSTREEFDRHCKEFYTRLSALYPQSKIFAISPIRRIGNDSSTGFGEPLCRVDDAIRELTAGLPNVTVINGFGLVPHDPAFFSPDGIHPVDLGSCLYAANLVKEMRKYL